MIFKNLFHYFDKLEDRVRHRLSKTPVLYAIIGGIAIVLFWRGVWHLADEWGMPAWLSFVISVFIMLITGTFVSFFIGEQLLLSGMREEKRIDEKTEEEIREEETRLAYIRAEIDQIRQDVEIIKQAVAPKKGIKINRQKPAANIKIRVVKK
jgi:low affinity Fe/Cu permease